MRRPLVSFFRAIHEFLHHPSRVFWACLIFITINLVIDGSLFRLWSLNRDLEETQIRVAGLQKQTADLKEKLHKAKDPVFMEREARDRFDLVSEGDLVFVFTEEE